jgi:Uma2 family endonuclease
MSLAARDLPSHMTAEEFLAWPDELPFAQLIDGEVVMNTPTARHGRLILEVHYRFRLFADAHPGSGEMGHDLNTVMDDRNVFTPDLWWVPDHQRPGSRQNRFDEVPPPLVVEVRSPSTWRYDVGVKLRRYEERGCAEVWLVDGEDDTVVVHRRSSPAAPAFDVRLDLAAGDVLSTPLVPGWEVELGALFSC